jgi:RNA polymerase sigma-70 factor (ECF subfamily)
MGFFRRLGAGLHQAEDLTQEVFLKLYHHAPRYRAEKRLQSFCLQVAKNVWIDQGRRRGARPRLRAVEDLGEAAAAEARGGTPGPSRSGVDPLEAASSVESRERLQRALSDLPDHHRMVFELGMMQELPYAEVAELLDIPIGTVKSRMFHALRKLREALGEEEQ